MKDLYRYSNVVVFFCIAIFIIILYSPALFSPVHTADSILSAAPLSHIGNAPIILSRDFTVYTDGQYRPLGYLVLAAVRSFVSAENFLFWHLWLLGFHILNTMLVFFISRRFIQHHCIAAIAAAAFAINPVCTTVVNDINQFHLLLGCTFSLATLFFYLGFTQKGGWIRYTTAVAFLLLSLCTARSGMGIGFLLFFYEWLYEQRPCMKVIFRTTLFIVMPFLFIPVWMAFSPNPIFYKYATTLTKGTFFYSFISVIGTTGNYLGGLLFSWGLPSDLHETAEQIFSITSRRFLFWLLIDTALFTTALYSLRKKQWPALGLLLCFAAMFPYNSTAFNRVPDYVSWSYLYFATGGFGLLLGGLAEWINHIEKRNWMTAGQTALSVILLCWAFQTLHINYCNRSPIAFWSYTTEQNPKSITAACELGKAFLKDDKTGQALHSFFFSGLKELRDPCLAMARYYLEKNNTLAASIHLRYGMLDEAPGLLYEQYFGVNGDLMLAMNALDHAEDNFGRIAMVNPYNTDAMLRLARIWHRKGRASAAQRMLDQIQAIKPDEPALPVLKKEFLEEEKKWGENPQAMVITPPDPEWLQYILDQDFTPGMIQKIITLADQVEKNDAVIQLESIIVLLENGETEKAAVKAKSVMQQLSGNAYACAICCRAFAMAGNSDLAVKAGLRAIYIDINNKMAWQNLAAAYARQDKPNEISELFLKAVQQQPEIAFVFYHELGLEKQRKRQMKEAADLFEKALKAQPNHYDAQLELGETLYELGRNEDAISAFRKSIALKPDVDQSHGKLGGTLLTMNQTEEAIKELRNAIQLEPNNALYHNNLGVGLAKQGTDEEAVKEYRRAVELNPNLEKAHFNMANSLNRLNRPEEAIAEYQTTLKIMPNHPLAHLNLGAVLFKAGKKEEAVQEFETQITVNPKIAQVYSYLISIYYNNKDYSKAKDTVKRAQDNGVPVKPELLEALRQ